jgi:hypothetical protein
MNPLIERYIYDVTRRLPEKERAEVRRELETSIADMLPDNPGERETADVLTRLGAPSKLAEQYRQKPRYLISPALFDLYISVLKTVTPIVAGVLACIGLFTALSSGTVGEVIGNVIGMAIEGALYSAFWVTVGFVIAERTGYKEKPWTLDSLPKLPDQKGVKISRSSTITGMAVTVFFTAVVVLLITRGEFVFIAVRGTEIINPFSQQAMYRALPFIFLTVGLFLIVGSIKLYFAKWSVPVFVASALYNVVWAGVAIHILHWPDLFSEKFVSFLLEKDVVSAVSDTRLGAAIVTLSAFIVIAAVIETAVSFWHIYKGLRKQEV